MYISNEGKLILLSPGAANKNPVMVFPYFLIKHNHWIHGHVQLINVYYCRAYGHTEEGSAKSPSLRNRTEDILYYYALKEALHLIE